MLDGFGARAKGGAAGDHANDGNQQGQRCRKADGKA
ncbi:hypothetical protein SDC9_209681 [bioreactor metagenome]|uniref:Uncharacterized protein n=1 Tax=bioreactor metagenome TaxID=1076179 RepID=A0A645JDY3_9ZZZZ